MQRRSVSLPARLRASLALVIGCLGAGASTAQTQDESFYDGAWNVRYQCGSAVCPARLDIADYGGTWQDGAGKSAAKRACGGRKMPLTVQSSTRSLLAFTVWGDGDSPACPTLSILVKPVDAKTLEGTFELGTHASESPEVHASHSLPAAPSSASRERADQAIAGRMSGAKTIRLVRR